MSTQKKRGEAPIERQSFSDRLNRAAYGGERVVIRRRGKPIAAVVPIEDLRMIEHLEDQADIRAARRARKGKSIPWEEIRASWGNK